MILRILPAEDLSKIWEHASRYNVSFATRLLKYFEKLVFPQPGKP
jgi:hypothetical protein